MSTHSQVEVKSSGLNWQEDALLLYHHTDGYPSYMLPVIKAAFDMGMKKQNGYWRLGRVGKAASYLCAADPGVFEPENTDGGLHCDIEWFYTIEVQNQNTGSMAERPVWLVSVFRPEWGSGNPSRSALKLVAGPAPITELVKQLLLT